MGEASLFSRVVPSVPTSKNKVGRFGQGFQQQLVIVSQVEQINWGEGGREEGKGREGKKGRRRRRKGGKEEEREEGREGKGGKEVTPFISCLLLPCTHNTSMRWNYFHS